MQCILSVRQVEILINIDIIVNIVGGLGGRSILEGMTTGFYRSALVLNLDSVFFASRAATIQ
jgi:hypothetical protein